jgi:pilus assembly protein CpaF
MWRAWNPPANPAKASAIRIRELVVNALRMRPDRIIVSECRSEEALDMLQAMNTGHDGTLTTVHAKIPGDAIGRLKSWSVANSTGRRSMRQQISSAIDMFVRVSRFATAPPHHAHHRMRGRGGQALITYRIFCVL